MAEKVVKEIVDKIKNTGVELGEEQIKEREELFEKAQERIKSYNLKWNFKSVNYVVKQCGITFNQLRSCIFRKADNTTEYDLFRALELIVKAGLIGSEQFKQTQTQELEDKTYSIIEDWRENCGFIGVLHILLINHMEKEHFFMGTQDVKVLELMSYKNLQRDIANTQMMIDVENKLHQTKAVQS